MDQIRGILDFFERVHKDGVIIAEAACGDTMETYKNFGYLNLADDYNVELIDLNQRFIRKDIKRFRGRLCFLQKGLSKDIREFAKKPAFKKRGNLEKTVYYRMLSGFQPLFSEVLSFSKTG